MLGRIKDCSGGFRNLERGVQGCHAHFGHVNATHGIIVVASELFKIA